MTDAAFFFAVLTLLLSPGPTNTLMGLAGARTGFRSIARLIPAELLGYLTAIAPLLWLGSEVLQSWPFFAAATKLVSGAWVMFLAVRLWRNQADGGVANEVTARRVYLTTTLNPKALVFGLVLLPHPGDPEFAAKIAIFGTTVMAVALVWGGVGSLAQERNGGRRLHVLRRIASGWLAVVSIALIAGVMRT